MQTVEKSSGTRMTAAGSPAQTPSPDELPLQRVYRWEREKPDAIFLTQPIGGLPRDWTWTQAMDESRRMAAYLSAQNWPPGSRIVILSKNCSWWIMAELAIWMSGHVTVPIYASLSAGSVRTLMEHCEPVACFIGATDDNKVLADGIPPSVLRITFPVVSDPAAAAWSAILNTTTPLPGNPVRAGDEIATIIYTSGTTGAPKGAMHRFSSFVHFATAALRVHGAERASRIFAYLSLAHIAERALVEAVAYTVGAQLFFVETIDTFLADLKRAHPAVFFSVPRLYLKFKHKVLAKVAQEKLDRMLRIPVLRTYVRRRILKELGLDNVKVAASGAASLPLATLLWFRQLGLNLVEGYGMTETGITHTPLHGRSKPGYVGDGISGVETKIAEDGEVLVRSPMNMVGYFRNDEATRECFTEDGFFHTGDMGELDEEGWLRIIGRVKEQFKTSKGKYISPNRIEKLLNASDVIEGCCVMGAETPQPFAIVTLSQETLDVLEQTDGKQAVEQELQKLMLQVNAQLEPYERLLFIVVTDQQWTVANGMLTPTMKLKRNILEATHQAMFESWCGRKTSVIWHFTVAEASAAR